MPIRNLSTFGEGQTAQDCFPELAFRPPFGDPFNAAQPRVLLAEALRSLYSMHELNLLNQRRYAVTAWFYDILDFPRELQNRKSSARAPEDALFGHPQIAKAARPVGALYRTSVRRAVRPEHASACSEQSGPDGNRNAIGEARYLCADRRPPREFIR